MYRQLFILVLSGFLLSAYSMQDTIYPKKVYSTLYVPIPPEVDGWINDPAFQFDSYHDLQTAFTFFVSAAGSKMDAYETENGEDMDDTWNPIWWVKTQVDDKGWTAEARWRQIHRN